VNTTKLILTFDIACTHHRTITYMWICSLFQQKKCGSFHGLLVVENYWELI